MRVEVMVGQLERSVAVWVNSTQQSTATPGQGASTMTGITYCMCTHCPPFVQTLKECLDC